MRDIQAATDAIRGASGEIAGGSQDLSSRTETAATSLEQTTALVAQLGATVDRSASVANEAFVGDVEKKKFLWTSPLMTDANLVVSNPSKRIEYNGPDSLKGMKFGGVTGNRYAGLDAIPRASDTPTELNNLKNAASGEIDVTVVPESVFRFYLKTATSSRFGLDKLYVSTKHHASFTRHLFVSPDQQELSKDLEGVVTKMATDPAWKELVGKYGFKS